MKTSSYLGMSEIVVKSAGGFPFFLGFQLYYVSQPSYARSVSDGQGIVLDARSCPALCSPVDCSLPASSVHGILQARILE